MSFKVGDKVKYTFNDKEYQITKVDGIDGNFYYINDNTLGTSRVHKDFLILLDTKTEEVHKSVTGSLRLNSGKPEVSQLDPRFIIDLAELITISAEKYGKFNYALGQEYLTPIDSLMRHTMKFLSGEDLDDESLRSHVLHMAANCMILYSSILTDKKELDNRFEGFKVDKE